MKLGEMIFSDTTLACNPQLREAIKKAIQPDGRGHVADKTKPDAKREIAMIQEKAREREAFEKEWTESIERATDRLAKETFEKEFVGETQTTDILMSLEPDTKCCEIRVTKVVRSPKS